MRNSSIHDTNRRGAFSVSENGLFAILVGLSVCISLTIQPLISLFKSVFFPLFALLIAVPLGTLRLRDRRIAWLGVKRSVATILAVFMASTPIFALAIFLPWSMDYSTYLPSVVDARGVELLKVILFIALTSLLAGWTAPMLSRWLDSFSESPFRYPDSRVLLRIICIGAILVATITLVWMLILGGRLSRPGPIGHAANFVLYGAPCAWLLGGTFLLVEWLERPPPQIRNRNLPVRR